MKRKTKTLLIVFITAVIVMAVPIAVYCGLMISTVSADMRLHSDMEFLNAVIREQLRVYYEQEGRYPENLDGLIPTIVKNCYTKSVPDEPKEIEMLSHFEYSSDGASYKIVWSFEADNGRTIYKHHEYGRNGALEKTELYINGQKEENVSQPQEEQSGVN